MNITIQFKYCGWTSGLLFELSDVFSRQCKERPVTESSSTLCCQPSALSIPGIQIYKFLCLANHHPYPSALHCGLQIFIFLRYSFDNFGSFAPSGPHATTFSSSSVDFTSLLSLLTYSASSPSCRLGRLRLHLCLVVLAVFAFISVSSSWPSSPSSPSCRLRRLRLFFFAVLAIFLYAITSSPVSPSPFT
ncbi:Uncharacterized protein APZ42_008380 [Daphnia magna]|uniref:Uncharacterized protein n=1 Tax=Daphnia magna TaxID=35525 RepID=A0A164EP01_9CRUS|nr:Uncharacterized protein APZ42_008380 [Daphnia magna]